MLTSWAPVCVAQGAGVCVCTSRRKSLPGTEASRNVQVRGLVHSVGPGNNRSGSWRGWLCAHLSWPSAGIAVCSAHVPAALPSGHVEGGAREQDRCRQILTRLPPQASGSVSPSSRHDPVSSSQTKTEGESASGWTPSHPGLLPPGAPRLAPLGSLPGTTAQALPPTCGQWW